jgi:hypothetical protein
MMMWNLGEPAMKSLMDMPETGMGFQLVEAVIGGNATPLLVTNCERAVDLRRSGFCPGMIRRSFWETGFA